MGWAILFCVIATGAWGYYVIAKSKIKSEEPNRIMDIIEKIGVLFLNKSNSEERDGWGMAESPAERIRRSNEYLTQENLDLRAKNEQLELEITVLRASLEHVTREAVKNKANMRAFNALNSDLQKAEEEIEYWKDRFAGRRP